MDDLGPPGQAGPAAVVISRTRCGIPLRNRTVKRFTAGDMPLV
jgi:hypothetical protein